MKILYIDRPKSEYLQEFLYTGLCKVLGTENIIEYPWNIRMHFNHRPYPKNLSTFSISNLYGSLKAQFQKDYDVVIVASCHPYTVNKYYEIMDKIGDNIPRVFIDGGDWSDLAGDLDRIGGRDIYEKIIAKKPFDLIFKREYILDEVYPENVFSLPMCFNYDLMPQLPTIYKYDVAFWAVESAKIRTQALELLEDKFDCKENGTVRNQVMKKYKRKGAFYLQEIASSKIGLNLRGGGWDTLRFWELTGMGCFVISQRLNIQIDHPFTDGEEIVYCKDDLSDLVELCEYYLEHEEERERIAKNARVKVEKHHTDVARARYVVEKIEELFSRM
ncbi:MAG: glycosyltransferase family 1 protein [Campylobacterales bacterium]|nr:glycosyltransferase family 1 protein [Campylobacterales bacterium]